MQTFQVWQNAWKDGYDEPLTLSLPDEWKVELHAMQGDSWPKLTKEQIREKILHPIGMETIRELAQKGSEACIVFDDLSRGTHTQEIAEVVLEELHAGGITREHIRFICALGTHAAHTRADFVRKLGEYIVENYPVFNHNPFFNLEQIGVDKCGNPVEINREFMMCDVRIGIGSVAPHPMNGYGGGGKILFPGIASAITTMHNHSRGEFNGVGNRKPSGLRLDIESMTRMVGSFFKIDAILNAKLDTIDLYAGDPVEEYNAATASSSVANAMEYGERKDVVIANANAKFNEALIAVAIANMELKPGGDIVLVNHCPCGQVVHYTYAPFGLFQGGRLWQPYEKRDKSPCGRIIYYSPFLEYTTPMAFNEPEKVVLAKTWDDVLRLLSNHGPGTTASVLSDGSIGYFPAFLKASMEH